MKIRKFISLTCLLFALSVNCIPAQESIRFEHLKYDEIIEKSKQEKKPVLIYFTGTGCFLCVKMEKNVFPKPEISQFYNNNFINVESFDDSRKPDSATRQLRRKFNIISNPSFIFIDSTGEIIHKSGYKETREFLLTAHQALSKQDNYKSWKQQLKTGKANATLMLKYLSAEQKPSLYAETNFVCDAQTELDRYFDSVPQNEYLLPDNWEIIRKYVANPYSKVFNYLLQQEKEFSRIYGEQQVNEVIYTILYDAWSGDRGSDAYKKAETFIRSSSHPVAKLRVLQSDYLYRNSTDLKIIFSNAIETENFIQTFNINLLKYPYLFNRNNVNTVANAILSNSTAKTDHYLKAKKWMQLILAIPENEDYELYATLALACFHTKDYKAAIDAQNKAIQLAIKDEIEKEELEQYQKKLSEYKQAALNR